MFKNMFRVAMRNKVFSFINIFGLAIGLATCLLITLYLIDENSYDKHQQYGNQIYRIASIGDKGDTWVATSAPYAAGVKEALPEVEQTTRLLTFPQVSRMLLQYEEGPVKKQLFESNGFYIDSTFFQLFSYRFVYGDAETALNAPNSIVISRDISEKFFATTNPVGKQITVNTPYGQQPYTISAVFDNDHVKSHIPARYFLSMRNHDLGTWVEQQTNWIGTNIFYTYVKLKEGTDAQKFEAKLQAFIQQKAGAAMKAAGFSQKPFIQPLKDIYLHSSGPNEMGTNSSIVYLYILSSIAIFILIIACVNFMNLSTATAEKRAREVGVRKALGAAKASLIRQFMSESFLLCMIALVLAIMIVLLMLPFFNTLTQKNIQLFDNSSLLLWITGLTLITALLSGAYPAFYLSAFNPVAVLKGKMVNSFSATAIRKGLVVFQFTISICLIFAAIIISQQLHYLEARPMGFNKEQKIILPLGQAFLDNDKTYTSLRNELLKLPEIRSVSSGSSYPGTANINDMLFFNEGASRSDIVDIHLATIENDYIETLGFKLLNGRTFSKDFTADSSSIILNETAVKQLGYTTDNAVGKRIKYDFASFRSTVTIVGVVQDFNYESLHTAIQPFGFTTTTFGNKYSFVIVSANTSSYASLLGRMKDTWAALHPSVPFEYSFLEQDFQRHYEREQRTFGIVSYFTIIAIFIACLGLFGLAIFSAEQRKKEIAIRKVLGASVRNVTILLSKDFIQLVLIAFVIATPLAWYTMNTWLNEFAFRIQISWWTFLIAGLLAIIIALLTVSSQAIKVALMNPGKTIKAE